MLSEILIAAFLLIGGVFALIGSYGLLRLKDPVQRLHAPTKGSTMGVGAVLIASVLWRFFLGDGLSWHEVVVTIFIFITAPLTALFLARTHLHRTLRRQGLPKPANGRLWAGEDLGLEEGN